MSLVGQNVRLTSSTGGKRSRWTMDFVTGRWDFLIIELRKNSFACTTGDQLKWRDQEKSILVMRLWSFGSEHDVRKIWSWFETQTINISSVLRATDTQTTDMNLGHAHCLASQAPTIDLWLEITISLSLSFKKQLFTHLISTADPGDYFRDSSESQNSDLKFLLYCKPKWHNKANRWEVMLAKILRKIQ
jgi:hypothetical protein